MDNPKCTAFFEDHGEYSIKTHFYECTGQFTVEDLYQAIKQRLLLELPQPPEE